MNITKLSELVETQDWIFHRNKVRLMLFSILHKNLFLPSSINPKTTWYIIQGFLRPGFCSQLQSHRILSSNSLIKFLYFWLSLAILYPLVYILPGRSLLTHYMTNIYSSLRTHFKQASSHAWSLFWLSFKTQLSCTPILYGLLHNNYNNWLHIFAISFKDGN